MVSLVVFAASAFVASAVYVPPYYGGNYGADHGSYGNRFGQYGGLYGGHNAGYDASDYEHAVGNKGYNAAGYGSNGWADGNQHYSNGGAEGHGDSAYEKAARAAADAEGEKKFSYFTSGSGPEGTYSKGYYGSEGYDHADSNSKHIEGANGGGYKKGYDLAGAEHHDSKSAYDKAADAHSGYGKLHDAAQYSTDRAAYDRAGHADGWVNAAHGDEHAAHYGKPY